MRPTHNGQARQPPRQGPPRQPSRPESSRVSYPTDVPHDLDVVDDDDPFVDHFVENRQKRAYRLFRVDDDDRNREVLRQRQHACRVDVAGGAVALHATEDAGAGETRPMRAFDDRDVQRLTVVTVVLTDVDGDALARPGQSHSASLGQLERPNNGTARAVSTPAHAATRPPTTVAQM